MNEMQAIAASDQLDTEARLLASAIGTFYETLTAKGVQPETAEGAMDTYMAYLLPREFGIDLNANEVTVVHRGMDGDE